MTAPNIEAIAASLRSCSLGGRTESPERQPAAAAAESRPPAVEETVDYDGVTVELNSEVALPYHWEQCLDLRTGELYYINWKDGTRTSEDPRLTTTRCRTSYFSSEEEEISDLEDEEAEEEDEDYCDAEDSSSSVAEGADYDDFYGINAEVSSGVAYGASTSSSAEAGSADCSTAGSQVLVAAGCKSCFMYFMVPKRVEACPKCGGYLLHLGRNGYF
ncbi:uncharacterized protein LOC110097582 [Dendrobium catenatum]|uniref:WW domain-containing protein n=1 Tax=Dendrobium catenatum TaxID=906689 RepID=A0A2I0X280_9ASPA|nr:uncharacterized protein LOC110097582 [Dendrobium catenatum]PKU82015.1 hypothetical protein MA16_Dca004032 [Dendrobium catenatum]